MRSLTRLLALMLAFLLIISAGCTEVTGTTTEPPGDVVVSPETPDTDPQIDDEQPVNDEEQTSEDPQSDVQQPEDETEDPAEPTPSPSEPTQPDDEQDQDQDEPGEDPEQPIDEDEPEENPEPVEEEPEEETLSGTVKVHYIDVGQGDSILIQAPSKTVLIDGGSRSAGSTVVSYLKKQGVSSIDIVISTHPHEDHIGGLIDVLNNFPVGEVIDPGIDHTSQTFEDYIDLILDKDIEFTEAQPGITRGLGGTAELLIIHPRNPSSSHLNDASVVVRLAFGSSSFLFAGDAEAAAETQMLNSGYTLASTVLKVGHHGSETSTSQAFLNKVKPTYAVISAGAGNSYEHPRQATLDKLKAANINTYRTDTHGNIVFTTDGARVSVSTAKSANADIVFSGADSGTEDPGEDDSGDDEEEPPATDPGDDEGQFVGSKESDKYHKPSCRYVEKILPENEIWFADAPEALAAGYVPCGACKPPQN